MVEQNSQKLTLEEAMGLRQAEIVASVQRQLEYLRRTNPEAVARALFFARLVNGTNLVDKLLQELWDKYKEGDPDIINIPELGVAIGMA